jgi:UMF1 family MFS transporter
MTITAAVFAVAVIPTFLFLRERAAPLPGARVSGVLRAAGERLWQTLRHLGRFRDFGWLMLCALLYQAGIAVVIALAAIYAQEAMGFTAPQTMAHVLAVNVTAAIGAFCFGYVQDAIGHRNALAATLLGWIVMVLLAAFAEGAAGFWVAANLAGLCMGSSQSAGRAMVGLFTPPQRLAEFYSLWNVSTWLASILGPVTYGLVTWLTHNNHRLAILVTGLYFAAGLLVLARVNVARGRQAAAVRD